VSWATIIERGRKLRAVLLRESGPVPRPSRWAWAADGALAAGLAVYSVYSVLSAETDNTTRKVFVDQPYPRVPMAPVPAIPDEKIMVSHHGGVGAGAVVAALLVALPLAGRRRYPLTAFWLVALGALLFKGGQGVNGTAMLVSCLVAAYSVAMYSPYRALAVTSLVAGGALIAGFKHDSLASASSGMMPLLLLLPLGLVANAVHTWKQRVQRLEKDREAAARLATERERARIARELHDVVTHSVSVMVVQAGAARTVLDATPDRAREAMKAVESTGRAALSELRHAMGLLTMTDDQPGPDDGNDQAGSGAGEPAGSEAADLAPQPGLADLPALAERMRATGMALELTVTGTPTAPLPPGVDLTAYRVVQESLTNVVKHASGAAVRVTVEHRPGAVVLEVADTGGTTTAPARLGNGRGLLGLRERLTLYGGTLHTGPRATGGFRVHAELPVDPVDPADPAGSLGSVVSLESVEGS
jgi:signal transduction histidine kinase